VSTERNTVVLTLNHFRIV